MGLGWILAGFLFLINPDLVTLDVIPDLIGYCLIAKGLYRLSFLEERIAAARRFAFFLVLSAALKTLSNLIVFSTNIESTRLTVMFGFFVAELWLGILLVDNAMKGIQYLAIRQNGDLALKGYEVVKTFLTVFVIGKSICSFLPTSLAIFFPEVDADPEKVDGFTSILRTYHSLKNILFVLSSVVVVALGIYTARVLFAYVSRIRSDRVFCENLDALYREKVTENASVQTRLSVKSAFGMFFVSFVFLADLYLDDISIIPLPFYFLFAALGLFRLKREGILSLWYALLSFVGLGISLVAYGYRLARVIAVSDPLAFPVLFVNDPLGIVLGVMNAVFVVITGFCMVKAVWECAKKHTDYGYRNYFISIVLCILICAILGFFQYRYPSTFSVLPSVQWGIFVVGIYLHKKSMDEIREEVDYRLM